MKTTHAFFTRWLLALAGALLLAGCTTTPAAAPQSRLTLAEALSGANVQAFAKATAPRSFSFPRDHGPHPEYAAEWWYYTGNLHTAASRSFGYQLTFFRFGLTPQPAARSSEWAASNIYMAHLAVTDVAGKQFYAFERFSRDAAGLAGAQGEPFRVWLDDWQASSADATGLPMRLHAVQGAVALDLTLAGGKPVVLQGDQGLSQRSATPGNASYYYSLPRMPTSGTITVGGANFAITGTSWMDREWSTSALGTDQVGWDWFALHLDDGRDLMFYRLRPRDGTSDSYSSGTLVAADGSTRALHAGQATLTADGTWRSPRNGARYPAAWRLQIPSEGIDLRVTPLLADQELPLSVTYWEGAVAVSGSASGSGYLEMTGYADQQNAVRVR